MSSNSGQDPWNQSLPQGQDYNFEIPELENFQQELNFQSFEAPPNFTPEQQNIYGANPYLNPTGSSAVGYGEAVYSAEAGAGYAGGDEFEDELPLLEELGINPEFIVQKIRG